MNLLKVIPHLGFIKLLALSGFPIKSTDGIKGIKEKVVEESFNSIDDKYYEYYINEMMDDKATATMVKKNRKIREDNSVEIDSLKHKPIISDPNILVKHIRGGADITTAMLSPYSREIKDVNGCAKSVYHILRCKKLRQYIEISILLERFRADIVKNWNRHTQENDFKLSETNLYFYLLYFWDVASGSLRKRGADIMDIYEYLVYDKQNPYYSPHIELMFNPVADALSYFGLMNEFDRMQDIRDLRGKSGRLIKSRLSKKHQSIGRGVTEIFSHTDSQLQEDASKGDSAESLRAEIRRMIERLKIMPQERKTLYQLKDEVVDTGNIEQDSPVKNK